MQINESILEDLIGDVLSRELGDESQVDFSEAAIRNYMLYGASSILDRAIPDIRDGLKPSQRRLMYAMKMLGLTHDKGYVKSARIIGETIGKYHPHGDTSLYDTLTSMSEEWTNNLPLIDGQGNWGSIDGDSPAAMRYTEARFTKYGDLFFDNINKGVVDFVGNYDDTLKEPLVLPARFPSLVINGSFGIATGIATSIYPFNAGEVMDTVVLIAENRIAKKKTEVSEVLKIIQGPDFPTGGSIYDISKSLNGILTDGEGSFRARASYYIEKGSRGKSTLVINEIPFYVTKEKLVEQISLLIKEEKKNALFDAVLRVNDETDKEEMRIAIDLKANANHEALWNYLCKKTNLDRSYKVKILALDSKKVDDEEISFPVETGVLGILERFVDFRMEILIRLYNRILQESLDRLNIVEGLIKAISIIDDIIKLVKQSKSQKIAKEKMVSSFGFNELQAETILQIKIYRLTGLEIEKLEKEERSLRREISRAEKILRSEKKRLQILIEEFIETKEMVASERRSNIDESIGSIRDVSVDMVAKREPCWIYLTKKGYLKRVEQKDFGKESKNMPSLADGDEIWQKLESDTLNYTVLSTKSGHIYAIQNIDIPSTQSGAFFENIVTPKEHGDGVSGVVSLDRFSEESFFVFVTKNGFVKKIKTSEISGSVRRTGIGGIKVAEGDEVVFFGETGSESNILIVSKNGKGILFDLDEVSATGRTSRGVYGIKLKGNDVVLASFALKEGEAVDLIFSLEKVLPKQINTSSLNRQSRGGAGMFLVKPTPRSGELVSVERKRGDENE